MTLTVKISDELLRRPGILEAVQSFLRTMAAVRFKFEASPVALPLARGGRVLPPVLPAKPSPPRPQYLPRTKATKLPKVKEVRPPKVKAPPAPKVKLPPEQMDFPTFEASLPLNSQRFLALVREKGIVRVEDVMVALELETPKAVGGITGAISRWAPVRGVTLPYDTLSIGGERIWRWHGVELPGEPEPAPRAPKAKKRLLTLDEVVQTLSAPARKLLDAVRSAGSVGINDAVSIMGVGRAAALSGLLAEIREATEANELRVLEDTVDMRGSRVFRWMAPVTPPPAAAPAEDPDKEYATDGVIRRRRKVN